MVRDRACGALIVDGSILMVRHQEPHRTFWTLPGGGIDPGETPEAAAAREMFEETGCRANVVRLLFAGPRSADDSSMHYCFLMALADEETANAVAPGYDPEEAHLPREERQLQEAAWKTLTEMRDDAQVSAVLRALALEDSA